MSSFVVSARKYRPSTFDTVVGQNHITTTLKNAIRSHHLAQAFLFCGPRGVGKTTCARILAKTINCTNLTSEIEACNECESCVSFNNNQSLNIFELDAASNNSVDDIRSLVEQVRFAPPTGKYKIYIIDEVHMLSQGAFNAFLKTLEEPPPYAIFILATTEKHKIIPTILSRCQIFDFNRIQVDDISKHLASIAEKEGIETEADALHIIAQKAEGALRDALSIFDQMVTFSGNKVTYKDVITNLNVLDYEYYFRITDQIIPGNISSVLLTFNELLKHGFDAHHFITGLSSHFRDLLVSKDEATIQLLDVTPGVREKYRLQSKNIDLAVLLKLIDLCNACDLSYKSARNQHLHVEIALMKMCSISGKLVVNENAVSAKPVALEKGSTPTGTPVTNTDNPVQKTTPPPTTVTSTPKANAPGQTKTTRPTTTFTPSLSDLGKPKQATPEQDNKADSDEKKNNNPVDKGKLTECWKEFAKKLDDQGNTNLAKALLRREPELINETEVHYLLDNQVLEDDLKELRTDFLLFLKTQLQNSYLTLHTQVTDVPLSQNKPYTAREKFQKMAEKNPALEKLRQQFDLNFD
ncbi:MAG: DNA polymerase III subunit gamma/tau [Bacteroidetes bacterium]|jgi:DNA polymerase-3 subunit gamma/tau|nr:DNA polymerase III subunit gamma/tau [Bacteroidota bacterium]